MIFLKNVGFIYTHTHIYKHTHFFFSEECIYESELKNKFLQTNV